MSLQARFIVELTWEVSDEDLRQLYPGDAAADFARRSFDRVLREPLNKLHAETGVSFHGITEPHFPPFGGRWEQEVRA